VFGGDARRLSLRACFPKMWQMETDHGGLVKALVARRRAGRMRASDGVGSPLGRLTSFRDGTEELVRALASRLGPALRLSASVRSVAYDGRYHLVVDGASPIDADAVVLAGGAGATAAQVESLDAALAADLRSIPCAPMVVVCLGFRVADMTARVDGFGFLVPRGEGPRLLGALWDSSVYPGRAPDGHALIRVMLGGAHDPSAIGLDDEAAVAVAREGLAAVMGERGAPCFTRVFRHPLGIPQYTVGHLDRLARIEERLARLPGLSVAGNAYRGVAINNCVADAGPAADRILAAIG
jgi:oxygen-dependent protoporphyrinogen oxidase